MQIDLDQLNARKAVLEQARHELKSHFIGIDPIIDNLLEYVHVWYLMPEILTRPIIVNLWGMTGVGKTDLIRRLVKALNFQDRFAEIELATIDARNWNNSVLERLEKNHIADERPSIVLFDEVQHFRTIDSDGEPMNETRATDFWELLSDGRLANKDTDELGHYLTRYRMSFRQQEQEEIGKRKKTEKKSLRAPGFGDDLVHIDPWEVNTVCRMLRFEGHPEEILEMTERNFYKLLVRASTDKIVYEPTNFSKMLIIISGNLDSAFTDAGQVSESDVDADIFHAYAQKVTIIDIKNALRKLYRPEEVARFGNIHLIYPSLTVAYYEQLITRELNRIIDKTATRFGLTLTLSPAINQLIYQNGVFPVQGVRPVFSSIIDIVESNLSQFVFRALTTGATKLAIDYDWQATCLVVQLDQQESRIPYTGRLDRVRQANEADQIANTSVHEAGHAVAYMALFGVAPLQLKTRVASSYAEGFTFPHQIHETSCSLLQRVQVLLAGGLAEELIFGADRASTGRSNDRIQATKLIMSYVRQYGFDPAFQACYVIDGAYTMNRNPTDSEIEKLIISLVETTRILLHQHQSLLVQLSIELAEQGSLDANAVAVIGRAFALTVRVERESYLLIDPYRAMLLNASVPEI